MKSAKIVMAVALLLASFTARPQSRSFQLLKDNFIDHEDVYCFKVNGMMCRAALAMAGELEFKSAIGDVSSVRIITIPFSYFASEQLSVNGFKRHLKKDDFELLASVKDHGDNVEIYLQQNGHKKDLYLMMAEEKGQVTVIEVKGYIDIDKLKKENTRLTYQSGQ